MRTAHRYASIVRQTPVGLVCHFADRLGINAPERDKLPRQGGGTVSANSAIEEDGYMSKVTCSSSRLSPESPNEMHLRQGGGFQVGTCLFGRCQLGGALVVGKQG